MHDDDTPAATRTTRLIARARQLDHGSIIAWSAIALGGSWSLVGLLVVLETLGRWLGWLATSIIAMISLVVS